MATLKYKNPATSAWETLDALPAIGQTVEITATELTGKSTADRAAMYAAGTRLLKVLNGDTEVLLGLDADGSTEWLGSNQPVNNLLDNSNFTNPVNQRGATSGTVTAWTYFVDRWQATDAALTYSIGSDGIHLTAGEAWMAQNVQSSEAKAGRTYTFAVGLSDGTFTLCTGALPAGETSWTEFAGENDENCYVRMAKITGAVISCSFKPKKAVVATWAALYEGAYTADTLPPYVPKGYAAELAECQRYFVSVSYNNTMLCGNTGDATGKGTRLYLPLATRMRINPTVSAFVVNASYYGGAKNNLTFTPSNAEATYTGICLYGNLSGAVSASPTYVDAVYQIRNADLAISADL